MIDDTKRKSPLDEMDELLEKQKKDLRDSRSKKTETRNLENNKKGFVATNVCLNKNKRKV